MKAVSRSNPDLHAQQLKTIAQDMSKTLTDEKARAWRLEMAISAVIFLLGSAILLTSTRVI